MFRNVCKKLGVVLVTWGILSSHAFASYLLDINIPSSILQVIEIKGESRHVLKTYAVVLGAKAFQTPVGSYRAYELTYNPGWIPPNTAWAKGKEEITPTQNGPLGPAALRFGEDLLIHGSPAFNASNPFASHGCVRMDNREVRELMTFLQNNVRNNRGQANLGYVDQNPSQSHRVYFYEPIAVNINYNRVTYQNGKILIHEDPYAKDPMAIDVALLEVLKQEGLWPKVDIKKMMAMVVKADSGSMQFEVAEIFQDQYHKSTGFKVANLKQKNSKS